ncbi:MAG: hypothetical protein V4722_13260 [Bacteroidota bacterium]
MKPVLIFLMISVTAQLSTAQNVGIGTNIPTARLEVVGQGNTASTNNLMLKNLSGDTLLRMRDNGYIGIGYNAANYTRTLSLGGNGINFFVPDNGPLAGAVYPFMSSPGAYSLAINSNQNLILMQSGGNVGIGTTTPAVSLQVAGAIATAPLFASYFGTSTTVLIEVNDKSFMIVNNNTNVDKNITLSDGLADGQRLTMLVRNTGTGTINVIDNPGVNNTDIANGGTFVMGDDDTISFIWDMNAGYWIETGRSDN